LFMDRGVRLDRTYQLNFGGNTDFLNMLERERHESKKISKTNAVTSMLEYPLEEKDVHVGPSDYVPWLLDRKWCYIRMEGTTFGDVPLNVEVKLEVWDSPNSAGVVIDAIRCCKLALDRGWGDGLSPLAEAAPHRQGEPRRRPREAAAGRRGRAHRAPLLPELRQVPRRDHAVPSAAHGRAAAHGCDRPALLEQPEGGPRARPRRPLRVSPLRQ